MNKWKHSKKLARQRRPASCVLPSIWRNWIGCIQVNWSAIWREFLRFVVPITCCEVQGSKLWTVPAVCSFISGLGNRTFVPLIIRQMKLAILRNGKLSFSKQDSHSNTCSVTNSTFLVDFRFNSRSLKRLCLSCDVITVWTIENNEKIYFIDSNYWHWCISSKL